MPPTDAPPANTKGKTPTTDLTLSQVYKRKVDVLKLCVLFVFAVKHYLREEDGLAWEDYADLIPKAFLRTLTGRNSLTASAYNAIDGSDKGSGSLTPVRMTESPERVDTFFGTDASKRIRVKRSIDKLVTSRTPLLSAEHRTISFSGTSMPLPLV